MPDSIFGELEFKGKDMCWPSVKCDRIAVNDDGLLLFVSVVAHESIVRGIRGTLSTNKDVAITASEIQVSKASNPGVVKTLRNFTRKPGGYREGTHRLGFNIYHAFFISKAFGVLLDTSDDHLWSELQGDRYTTPMLREWLPWLKARLMTNGLLKEAWCMNCEAGALLCTDKDLDLLVTQGLANHTLTIPTGEAA